MTKPISWSDAAVLEINARHHRHDPVLERACELWDTDRAAFDRLPASVKSQADVYRDLRQYRRDAVEAGVFVPTDRDPSAA
jgi:ferric-dicitrate binding protein FerR (iron transport regulator)